jgi:hypothetical protein
MTVVELGPDVEVPDENAPERVATPDEEVVPPEELPDPKPEWQTVPDDPETGPEEAEGTVKSVNQIAHEVIAGGWGRGNVRKQRLQDAGYDVAEVALKSLRFSTIVRR